jgi:hypothetical protein
MRKLLKSDTCVNQRLTYRTRILTLSLRVPRASERDVTGYRREWTAASGQPRGSCLSYTCGQPQIFTSSIAQIHMGSQLSHEYTLKLLQLLSPILLAGHEAADKHFL